MSERNKRSFDDILGMSLLSKYVDEFLELDVLLIFSHNFSWSGGVLLEKNFGHDFNEI